MRCFVRVESGRVVTLAMDEHDTVQRLKCVLAESGQTRRLDSQAMVLMAGDQVLRDSQPLASCVPPHSPSKLRLHCVLYGPCAGDSPFAAARCDPAPKATLVALQTRITVELQAAPSARVCVQLFGEGEFPCDGALHALSPTVFAFTPTHPLSPSHTYTVRACLVPASLGRGPPPPYVPPPCCDLAWTFSTCPLPPLRVVARELTEGEAEGKEGTPKLVTLARNAGTPGGLLAVVRATIARRFGLRAGEVGRVVIVRPQQGEGEGEGAREGHCVRIACEGDGDVIGLRPGDKLLFRRATGPPPSTPGHGNSAQPPPPASRADYLSQHWVNRHAGFFAVAGKMTKEEENALLLAVVRELDEEQAHPQGIHNTNSSNNKDNNNSGGGGGGLGPLGPSDSQVGRSGGGGGGGGDSCALVPSRYRDSDIPADLIDQAWVAQGDMPPVLAHATRFELNPHPPFVPSPQPPLDRPCDHPLLLEWRARGFVVVQLPESVRGAVGALALTAQQFFGLGPEQKAACRVPGVEYLGYRERPAFHKELFQFRYHGADAPGLFPDGSLGAAMRTHTLQAFSCLHDLAFDLAALACRGAGMTDEVVRGLREVAPVTHLAAHEHSLSNITMFHYHVAEGRVQENVHCPYHTDVTLATVIPLRLAGQGGLHVFGLDRERWLDIEQGAPPGSAVVFGGESLARATNGFFLPCIHDVSLVPASRLSIPVQCCARAAAVFDYRHLDPRVVGECRAECAQPITSGAFVSQTSAARVSSNFPRPSPAQ